MPSLADHHCLAYYLWDSNRRRYCAYLPACIVPAPKSFDNEVVYMDSVVIASTGSVLQDEVLFITIIMREIIS